MKKTLKRNYFGRNYSKLDKPESLLYQKTTTTAKTKQKKSNVPYRTLFHKTVFRMNPKRLLIIQFDDQSTLNCRYIPSHDGTNENL